MSALTENIIQELICALGTDTFIKQADRLTQGLVSSYVQEAVDKAIIEALTDYINEENIRILDLPKNWRNCLAELLQAEWIVTP